MELLEKIIKDVSATPKVKTQLMKMEENELYKLHFSIGLYIRNKFLWGNILNIKNLSKHYDVYSVDDISSKIIFDIYMSIKNKKNF